MHSTGKMRIGVNIPKKVHWYIPSENVHGHIPMESHTCCGLRLSLTSPSMMAGSWVSIKVLHCCSIEAPRRLPRVWHSSLKNCTIWSSVVSLVMKLSRSVMMSTQIEQVKSFLMKKKYGDEERCRCSDTVMMMRRMKEVDLNAVDGVYADHS